MLDFSVISTNLQIITIIVLGVFSFVTLYDRFKRGQQKDVILNFRQTIDSMKERMAEMEIELEHRKDEHHTSLEKIAHLSGENKVLRDLLLGRDPESNTYRDKSLELLQTIVNSMNNMAKELEHHSNFVKKAHPEVL